MNAANSVTLARLALIPVFAVLLLIYQPDAGHEGIRIAAFVVFVVAAASDGIDGFIARRFDQKTRLGAMLDPLADKLLTNISFVFLAALEGKFTTTVPLWVPVVILMRDITITGGSYLLAKHLGPIQPRPRILGKLATWAHSVAIAAIVINLPYSYEILMITVTISVFSMADYLLHGYEANLPGESGKPDTA
jgi:CDP-diacylglycerol--glycerol-3-phosphate 3-phosphatidyltransferase